MELMYHWTIEQQNLSLKFLWKISRGASQTKRLYFVRVTRGDCFGLGEVAGLTSNDPKTDPIFSEFETIQASMPQSLEDIQSLSVSAPLRFALESAFVHIQSSEEKKPIEKLLNLPTPREVATSFSLPILPPEQIQNFHRDWGLERFQSLKLKIERDQAIERVQALAKIHKGPIRIDANESFQDLEETLNFMRALKGLPIEFVEQPLPQAAVALYKKLKPLSPLPIMGDESIQGDEVTSDLVEQFHGINVKLMKAGGYYKAIEQMKSAKALGLKVMLGCMVESSLGIFSALQLTSLADYYDLDGFLFFQNEPFSFVHEKKGKVFLNPEGRTPNFCDSLSNTSLLTSD